MRRRASEVVRVILTVFPFLAKGHCALEHKLDMMRKARGHRGRRTITIFRAVFCCLEAMSTSSEKLL